MKRRFRLGLPYWQPSNERVQIIRRELITGRRIPILNRRSRYAVAVAVVVPKLLDDLPPFAPPPPPRPPPPPSCS